MIDDKLKLKLSLLGAFIISALGYILLTSAGDGRMTIAESDQLVYMQYARNMAQGSPLVFSPGDAPSTGSTTYLYIFILSIFYKLGASGEAAFLVSYLLNTAFYLGSVWMLWKIARVLVPKAVGLAMAMSVLSFHLAAAVLKQTDIGLLTFLMLALFASLLHHSYRWAAALAVLCALTRPEGLVFAIAFACCAALQLIPPKNKDDDSISFKGFIVLAGFGFLAFAATILLNFVFTGDPQFISVAHKGYFNAFPFSGAIQRTLIDAVLLLKGVFFGLQDNVRQFYLFPILAGSLGLLGILLNERTKTTSYAEIWFGLSAAGTIVLIASSQFAGVSDDRYLAWILPVWTMYVIAGAVEFPKRLGLGKQATTICMTLLIGFQFAGLIRGSAATYGQCVSWESRRTFAMSIKETIPASKTIGGTAGNSFNYYLPDHKIYNVWGVTSPDFHNKRKEDARYLSANIDLIRNKPELEFDYWATDANTLKANPWMAELVGAPVISDMDQALVSEVALSLYKADWSLIRNGREPVLLEDELDGLSIIDGFDVGFYEAEKAHDYMIRTRLKSTRISPICLVDTLGDLRHLEGGRLVLGAEHFRVRGANPSKPLHIVLRTGIEARATAYFNRQLSSLDRIVLNEQLHLRMFVDGEEVEVPPLALNPSGYSEVKFVIPSEILDNESPRIEIVGDHISYAYWFAQ